ncbi:MAG: protoglobin domain-containing protein [Desulfobacteraceae bacterium]
MKSVDEIRRNYRFTVADEEVLPRLARILLPLKDQLASDFYDYLMENPETAAFFPTEEAVERRKQTIKDWLELALTGPYDRRFVLRMEKVGRVHVKIGLPGHYVSASMNFIRCWCVRQVTEAAAERKEREELLETLDKVLDINLDVMTESYREAELKQVFLSYRVESELIRWSERLIHGLNLILMIGLLVMALSLAALFAYDVYSALAGDLERGIIKALGSLLILWMMIELLHTEVSHLRGGKFHVRIFVELALAAFIRKVFVAVFEKHDPLNFGLLLAALFVLGLILFLVDRKEEGSGR